MKAPISTKGDEQQSQSSSKVIIVEKGTVSESSNTRKKLTRKKMEKANEGYRTAVNKAVFNQSAPLNILYNLADQYPAIPPMNTNSNNIIVSKPPRW